MPLYLDISIALVVFMGLASGGILSLVLMSERRQQTNFSIMLALSLFLALGGGTGMIAALPNVASSLTNMLILLVLSMALGYTLTAFSVLSPKRKKWSLEAPQAKARAERTAVILLMPGEPPEYSVWSAARRLELADDPKDVPPILLRPFYMRDLKHKYAALGSSPYREHQHRLAEEIRSRLESGYSVYEAYYSDHPTLAEAAVEAIEEGARRIIVAHVRVTDPPDPVMQGELWEGFDLDNLGVKVTQVGPVWVSSLLPQIYVRRVIEAIPQAGNTPDDVGLLLVGRGHATEGESAQARQEQEESFQRKVRQALLRVGFGEDRVVIGWVRRSPNCAEALQALVVAGCTSVYVIPSAFVADGITTLFDIPAQVQALADERGVKLSYLPAWNADGLAAEEIAVYVRAVSAPALMELGIRN
ncbi:MAG TPA: ferrochelatase [Chloroflexia bacterium]|nr:ferrochelatase [Chloroflexia bacterium]